MCRSLVSFFSESLHSGCHIGWTNSCVRLPLLSSSLSVFFTCFLVTVSLPEVKWNLSVGFIAYFKKYMQHEVYVSVNVRMCTCHRIYSVVDKITFGSLSFQHMRPEDWTPTIKLSDKCLYLLRHLTNPILNIFLDLVFIFIYVCMTILVWVNAMWVQKSQGLEEGVGFLGSGITSTCEPSTVDIGNQTQVLQRSSKNSLLPMLLFFLYFFFFFSFCN